MREIKFRAWDKNRNKMVYFENLHTLYSYEERFKLNAKDINMGDGLLHDDFIDHYDKLPLMQYIGIKDEGSKEIYEGDIVSGSLLNICNDHKFNVYGIVVYYEKTSAYGILSTSDYIRGLSNESSYPITNQKLEVVGNIYESPELIK